MSPGWAGGLLARAGQNGPALLCGGVLVGLVMPPFAEAARPLMGLAVFVFTLGAFLKVDAAALRGEAANRFGIAAVLAWTTFGVPLVVFALVQMLRPAPDLALGLLLIALAPPVGSAAAIAAMLGLSAPLALLATIVATLAAPFLLPPLAAALAGADLAIDPVVLSARLAAVVGGAAAVAWLLRRCAGRWVAENPSAMTGIAVLGLLLVAVGAMHGMQDEFFAEPGRAAALLGLAFLVNAGLQAVGTLLFWAMGPTRALTIGLVSGNRNVTLVWVAAAPFLADQPGVELFLAASVFPIFMLPLATRWLLGALRHAAGAPALAGPPPRAAGGRARRHSGEKGTMPTTPTAIRAAGAAPPPPGILNAAELATLERDQARGVYKQSKRCAAGRRTRRRVVAGARARPVVGPPEVTARLHDVRVRVAPPERLAARSRPLC